MGAADLHRLSGKEERNGFLSRRKSDPAKLALAVRLRRKTTLSIKAIAQRLRLGTSKSANIRSHAALAHPASASAAQPVLGL